MARLTPYAWKWRSTISAPRSAMFCGTSGTWRCTFFTVASSASNGGNAAPSGAAHSVDIRDQVHALLRAETARGELFGFHNAAAVGLVIEMAIDQARHPCRR